MPPRSGSLTKLVRDERQDACIFRRISANRSDSQDNHLMTMNCLPKESISSYGTNTSKAPSSSSQSWSQADWRNDGVANVGSSVIRNRCISKLHAGPHSQAALFLSYLSLLRTISPTVYYIFLVLLSRSLAFHHCGKYASFNATIVLTDTLSALVRHCLKKKQSCLEFFL